jgi:hypothetical protein
MTVSKPLRLAWLVLTVGGVIGGCECQRSTEEDTNLERPPLAKSDPKASPPKVNFPSHCRTEDTVLNQFIEQAMTICAKGDYEGFRQLFSTSFAPPGRAEFDRVWYEVESVDIVSTHLGKPDPPEYYVHAVVQLRQADRRGRKQRDVVVAIFKEANEWRMAPPSKDYVRRVMLADSQPAQADSQPAQ